MMRRMITATALLLFSVPLPILQPRLIAQDEGAPDLQEDPRVEAASAWLRHLDRGELEMTWETASPQSPDLFTRQGWTSTLRTARSGLGRPEGRDVVEATEIPTPPAAPDGEYARVTFRSRFPSRTLSESVSLIRSDEGGWRVFGYRAR